MSVRNYLFYLTVCPFVLIACQNHRATPLHEQNLKILRALDPARAAADAQQRIGQGDCHLLTTGGAFSVPLPPDAEARFGVKEIKGTGEIWRSDEERKLNIQASDYAKKYNAKIVASAKCNVKR